MVITQCHYRTQSSRTMIVLKAGGARTIVELTEANQLRERFERELKQFGECHTLNLSCRAWRLESLKALDQLFPQIKTNVRVLLIDDIIASLPTEEGLACFEYLAGIFCDAPLLNRVNLNDNAIGSRGITCLRPLLTNPSVTALSLENCGLAEADGAFLKELLTTSDSNGRRLLELSLSRNQMGAGGATFIGDLLGHECIAALQSFSYAGSRPLPSGTKELCRGLAKLASNCGPSGTKLYTLDLNDCCVGSDTEMDSPLVDLCKVLRNSPRLHNLILRDGEFDVFGLKMVLDALEYSNAPISVLDLGAIGELGTDGGRLIRDFLLSNGPASASIQELYLDTNELGDDGAAEIVTGIAVSCRSLSLLDLSQNELVNIVPLLRHNHIPSLCTLKLEDNPDLETGKELQELRGLYREVLVDEDLENNDNDDDDIDNGDDGIDDDLDTSVNALADILDITKIE
jgi:Ran GTPase-activating protein (RanGAP) involved in mRNA processing and transport